MIGIVSAVCREVECYRKTFLTRSQVTTIECVGFFGGGETGILTDSPGTNRIHAAVRATQEGRNTGYVVEVFKTLEVFFGINGFYGDLFRGYPVFTLAGYFPCRVSESILCNIYVLEIRSHSFLFFFE